MADGSPSSAGSLFIKATPLIFVLLWSTGFIGAKLGLPHAEPMTMLSLRFFIVAGILAAAAFLFRSAWPSPRQAFHTAVAGLALHGVYLGGVFAAIDIGVEAGASALIVSCQPLLVAALAGPVLGETVTRRQWAGLLLGLIGVVLVIQQKLAAGLGTPFGMALCVMALFGITFATLYQKKYCAQINLVTGNAIQAFAVAVALGLIALAIETREITWHPDFVIALVWLVFVLSIGAISLLFLLIRRGAAAKVSSLFFLVPPATAVIAWLLFGETFGTVALVGMGLVVTGVAMVNLQPKS
ncbi:MAG: DMT family transporter [Alphaproteobacteria bacterium]|nr:DMT family transporter [Alphaproteobacteria bacterium]